MGLHIHRNDYVCEKCNPVGVESLPQPPKEGLLERHAEFISASLIRFQTNPEWDCIFIET
jgi:hypothetical protein